METGTFPLRELAARASGWHSSPVATAELRSALAQFAAFARSLKGNEKRRSIYAWRGETDKAFEWLQVSFDNHDTGTLSLLIDPLMRGLHHDARYNGLLAKIGLPVSL
jgi:hypothetical protein